MKKSLGPSPSETRIKFLDSLGAADGPEEKIRLCLEFMKRILAEEAPPQFRSFWEARSLCLALFKEKIPPRCRTFYWADFISLSNEMRRVKEFLEEQSSFAVEQIELAIEVLKKSVDQMEPNIRSIDPMEIPDGVFFLKVNHEVYIESQKEIDYLSALAGRLNSLRKELIRTPMRIRKKNRMFEELSELGNVIFPRRKKAIEVLSESFLRDLESFQPDLRHPLKAKEEIKALQAFAKSLAINTKAFSHARETLSGFWEQIREQEKERRLEKAKQREESKESFEKMSPQIDFLKEQCSEGEVTWAQAKEQEAAILDQMRKLTLAAGDVKLLKRRLAEAIEPLENRRVEELARLKEQQKYKQEQREKALQGLLDKLTELGDRAESLALDTLAEKWDSLVKEEKDLNPAGIEKKRIQGQIDRLYDHIQEKQWHALRNDSSEEGIQQVHELLDSRHKARRKLKEVIESLRKTVGGSGLSIEQSFQYQEMIEQEKLRLDAIETMIEEIEEKLFQVEE